MFGFKSFSHVSLKVNASKDFIQGIKDVKTTSSKELDDKRLITAKNYLEEAKTLINSCIKNNDFSVNNIKLVTDNLLKSIENNRNNPEAYLNLANIFYILGDVKLSLKYLKITQEMSPNLTGTSKLRDAISSNKIISKNENPVLPEEKIENKSFEKQTSTPQGISSANSTLKPIVRSNVKSMYSVSSKRF